MQFLTFLWILIHQKYQFVEWDVLDSEETQWKFIAIRKLCNFYLSKKKIKKKSLQASSCEEKKEKLLNFKLSIRKLLLSR